MTHDLKSLTSLPVAKCYYDIVMALRNGSKAWVDTYGVTTYHIEMDGKITPIIEPMIETLKWYGLINIVGGTIELTYDGKYKEITILKSQYF